VNVVGVNTIWFSVTLRSAIMACLTTKKLIGGNLFIVENGDQKLSNVVRTSNFLCCICPPDSCEDPPRSSSTCWTDLGMGTPGTRNLACGAGWGSPLSPSFFFLSLFFFLHSHFAGAGLERHFDVYNHHGFTRTQYFVEDVLLEVVRLFAFELGFLIQERHIGQCGWRRRCRLGSGEQHGKWQKAKGKCEADICHLKFAIYYSVFAMFLHLVTSLALGFGTFNDVNKVLRRDF